MVNYSPILADTRERTSCRLARKVRGVGILAVTLCAGCGSRAEKTVEAYLNQKSCKEREQFILEPEKHRDALATYYREYKGCVEEHGKVDGSSCKGVAVGAYCDVSVEKVATYCVQRTEQGTYKIDWPCSVGWNSGSLKAFAIEKPRTPTPFRVVAELDTLTEARTQQHFVVKASDASGGVARVQMPRSRVSATELYELLRDGRKHRVLLTLGYGIGAEIVKLVRKDWRTLTTQEEAEVAESAQSFPPGRVAANCCAALPLDDTRFACVRFLEKVESGEMTGTQFRVAAGLHAGKIPPDCAKVP